MILRGPFGAFEGTLEECVAFGRLYARAYKPKSPIERFDDSVARLTERWGKEPRILLLSQRDFDRMETLMREGLRLPVRKEPGWQMRFNGIELGIWRGVDDGSVVGCDEDFKVMGSFAWVSQ